MQTQYMYQTSSTHQSDTQNQLSKFRILCNVKDRKITELEGRCAEFLDKYNSDVRALKHKVELSESRVAANDAHQCLDTFSLLRSEIRW